MEYAGGYSDMVAQRGQGVQARIVDKPAEKSPRSKPAEPDRSASVAKRKLNFNEQHDLKTLPGRMGELEGRIARLQGLLADPDLYARDPGRFEAVSAQLAGLQDELSAAEDRWLSLEMLREELGG